MSVIDSDGSHREVLLADPRELLADADNEDVPAEEKARRERAREGGQGVVSYSVDSAGKRVAFTINGQLFISEIDEDGDGAHTRQIMIGDRENDDDKVSSDRLDGAHSAGSVICTDDADAGGKGGFYKNGRESSGVNDSSSSSKWLPVLNPRISPDGRHIAYTTGTRLVMVDIAEWDDGAEFVAATLDPDVNEAGSDAGNGADSDVTRAVSGNSASDRNNGGVAARHLRSHGPHPHTCAAEAQEAYGAGGVNDTNVSGDRFSTVWSVGNDTSGTLKIGLAEFVAGEEMDRYDGFWWAPDSRGLLFEMYDSSPEPMWYISDPAHPDKPAAGRRYARALTKNAIVRLMLAHLEFGKPNDAADDGIADGNDRYNDVYDNGVNNGNGYDDQGVGEQAESGEGTGATHYIGCDVQNVSWDREAYEYVAAVSWEASHEPLVLVQNRRQTRDQVLEVRSDGRTRVLEEHANDQWIDLVPGTPDFTPDGRLVCALNDMDTDTNRLAVDGKPFTPVDWQVRTVLDISDENVLVVVQRTPHEAVKPVNGDVSGLSAVSRAAKMGVGVAESAVAATSESACASSGINSGIGREAMEIASERGSLPAVPLAWRGDEALHDARSYDVVAIDFDGNITPVTAVPGVWSASRAGNGIVVSGHDMAHSGSMMVHALAADGGSSAGTGIDEAGRGIGDRGESEDGTADNCSENNDEQCADRENQVNGNNAVNPNDSSNRYADSMLTNDSGYAIEASIASHAEAPGFTPNTEFVRLGEHRLFTAITRPSASSKFAGVAKLPVLLKPYGGPGFQQVTFSQAGYSESQWWADQGFIVVTADGRGTTGRGPKWDREIFENMKDVTLADQVEAVRALPNVAPDADIDHVAMIGWSYGGFLSALAVLDAPDVIHAACAGAPPTEWTLYDTHYTERYLGLDPAVYERNSIVADAPKLTRPLMLIHGFADDNVTIANSLRLSQALMEAGRPHTYLPLTGITHMTNDPKVAENLLILQRDFLYDALGIGN
ncbi:prolyl oligopeptidase family serine peptidase [Bifidobacterium sp. ESL0745]|uniref:S9 family peptidase n=1 Tax=Bifidobacterium sp. ESL0745 TaxID=2983226 RepID=UPI0032AFAB55